MPEQATRWTAERPEILAERVTWHPEGATDPLTLDLAPLFARIYGDRP